MKRPKSEEKIEIRDPLVVRGPSSGNVMFFSAKNCKQIVIFHNFKMKWPKSEEKINIGKKALEKLWGPPEGVPPSQKSGCATVDGSW